MARILFGSVLLLCVAFSGTVQARDDRKNFSVQEAYDALGLEARLEGVKMYFKGASHPAVKRSMGVFRTNRKTNSFNKSDMGACQWAFLSTMLALKDRALAEGGNAVINIKSNYKNREFSSATEFQCGVGKIIAGVALIGEVVKIGGGGSTSSSSTSTNQNSSATSRTDCSVKTILEMKNSGMTDDQVEAVCNP